MFLSQVLCLCRLPLHHFLPRLMLASYVGRPLPLYTVSASISRQPQSRFLAWLPGDRRYKTGLISSANLHCPLTHYEPYHAAPMYAKHSGKYLEPVLGGRPGLIPFGRCTSDQTI
eukprot:scaffold45839_cov17-Prasinocladus_malaysianus.AAC.1